MHPSVVAVRDALRAAGATGEVGAIAMAALLGVAVVRRADPDTVRAATGQVIGGVAPLGHPTPLKTLVDSALAAYDVIWAAAGHAHTMFPTTYDELLRVTGGQAAQVAG